MGLHDEIFQGATPVLAGVDAASTYCYLLAAEERRDADTWGVHLLDAAAQGLRPDYTIADARQGLRAGQRAAWGGTPCYGDVFHIMASAKASPTRCSASPRAPRLDARRCRPRPAAPASGIQTASLSSNWSWPVTRQLTGAPSGCRVLSWRSGYHLAARAPAVMAKEARRLTARTRPAAR